MTASVRLAAQNLFQKTTRNLLNNIHNIDSTSVASTINLLSKKSDLSIQILRPDTDKCRQIEDHIMSNWEVYMNQDISVVTAGLMRLSYTP